MTTAQGKKKSAEYNEGIRIACIKWAMVEILKHPPLGFEEVVNTHFKLKREFILKQTNEWMKEAISSKTPGYLNKLQHAFEELKTELNKLNSLPVQSLQLEPETVQPKQHSRKSTGSVKDKQTQKAEALHQIFKEFPLALCLHAVKVTKTENEAANWCFEKGEEYLSQHPDLLGKQEVDK